MTAFVNTVSFDPATIASFNDVNRAHRLTYDAVDAGWLDSYALEYASIPVVMLDDFLDEDDTNVRRIELLETGDMADKWLASH